MPARSGNIVNEVWAENSEDVGACGGEIVGHMSRIGSARIRLFNQVDMPPGEGQRAASGGGGRT